MPADLGDAPMIEHDDLVGFGDGVQPVGDHEHSPVVNEAAQRLLHKVFRFGIGERRRLVQDQDRCVGEQRPGDGEALAFAAGKLAAGAEHTSRIRWAAA